MLDYIINDFIHYDSIRNILFFVVLTIILYLAWISTNLEPLRYRIWVAQLFSSPSHRMLQLYNHGFNDTNHQFFRAPGDYNWSPFVTTLIIVKKPNSPPNRNLHSNFFRHLQTNPIEEFENQEFSNFIIEHVQETDLSTNDESENTNIVQSEETLNTASQSFIYNLLSRHRNQLLRQQRTNRDELLENYENEVSYSEETATNVRNTEVSVNQNQVNTNINNININGNVENIEAQSETLNERRMDIEINTNNKITVELKIKNEESKFIETELSTTVLQFKIQCFSNNSGNVNLLFRGVLLENDEKTLCEYGLYDKCIVEGEFISIGETMAIRLKHLDDSVINAVVPSTFTVGDLKRTHYAENVAANNVIRLIFQGQLLRNDSRTLQSYGVVDKSVIHVHIGQRAYRQEGVPVNQTHDNESQQPVIDNIPRFGPHPITGFQWLDTTLYTLLSCILWLGHWAEADDVQDEDESIFSRIGRGIRSIIRPIINFVTNAYAQLQNQDRDQELVHNFGIHFPLVIFLKIILLMSIGFMYQDMTDSKTILLLIIISSVAIFYAYAAYGAQRVIQR